MIDTFLGAIYAGIMIAIAAVVNLTVGGIAGAALFSVGLFSILVFKFYLYTGKAGLIATSEISFRDLFLVLWGNAVGAVLAGILVIYAMPHLIAPAASIWQTRMATHPVALLIKSIFCGILMYIAVTSYNKLQKIECVILPVMTFILAGFSHSIADMAYFMISGGEDGHSIIEMWPLLVSIIGNYIGCNLIPTYKAAFSK